MADLDREAFSPFGSASIQHFATTFSRHTRTKSVCSLSFNITRLVCSLHMTPSAQYIEGGGILWTRFYTVKYKSIYIIDYLLLLLVEAYESCV